ncbi:MAG: hypothetical protein WKH64_15195 [Chloroflexia bacterium]
MNCAAHPRYRQTDVDHRSAGVEQVALQIDRPSVIEMTLVGMRRHVDGLISMIGKAVRLPPP